MENNCISANKWELTHNQIDCWSEEHLLLKTRVVELKSLLGLQQTALQHCQDKVAGLEETIVQLVTTVKKLEKTVCQCHDQLLSLGPVIILTFGNVLEWTYLFWTFLTFILYWDWSWPPCSHDLCLFLFICFMFPLYTITWPREVIIILWSFYDFRILFYRCTPTLIFFSLLYHTATLILTVDVLIVWANLQQDMTRTWHVERSVPTVQWRTSLTPD